MKTIQRAESKKQGRVHRGLKSGTFAGFSATEQFNPWCDEEDTYEDKKVNFRDVKLPNWSNDSKEQQRIMEEMSGEVVTYSIDKLKGGKK